MGRMIPKVGEFYHFWDDGKHGLSRHYIAKVERIIPFEVAESVFINDKDEIRSLLDCWEDEVKEYKWLYNTETDFFIECSIPKYDNDPIFFVRDKYNEWFSIETTGWWQGGRLNVDGSIYEEVLEDSSDELKEEHKNVEY